TLRITGFSSSALLVGVIPALVRTNNGSLNKSRKRFKPLLIAGCVILNWFAALVTLPSRSSTSKYTSKFKSTFARFKLWMSFMLFFKQIKAILKYYKKEAFLRSFGSENTEKRKERYANKS
ncbi:MAG: hypothetical protein ACJAW1_001262, partial [Glaciecola sp.]